MTKPGVLLVGGFLVVCLGGQVQANVADGLVAYYPFSTNANDESGSANHGTVRGASLVEDRCGVADSAYAFDGVNDYIDFGAAPTFDISGPTATWSVAAWVRFDGDMHAHFLGKLDSLAHGWNITVKHSRFLGRLEEITDATNSFNVATNEQFSAVDWHFVYVQWNASASTGLEAISLFVDGLLRATYVDTGHYGPGVSYNNSGTLVAGGIPAFDNFFAGQLDEVRIYNRALTAEDLALLSGESCDVLDVPAASSFGLALLGLVLLAGLWVSGWRGARS